MDRNTAKGTGYTCRFIVLLIIDTLALAFTIFLHYVSNRTIDIGKLILYLIINNNDQFRPTDQYVHFDFLKPFYCASRRLVSCITYTILLSMYPYLLNNRRFY